MGAVETRCPVVDRVHHNHREADNGGILIGLAQLGRRYAARRNPSRRTWRGRPAPCRRTIRALRRSVGEDGFVAEDAVEGGAADVELAGGAELVAAVEVEYILHVLADDGIEREAAGWTGGRLSLIHI